MGKTVITFGTYDLFHYGHLRIIQRARQLGDRLVVGVSSDALNYSKITLLLNSYNMDSMGLISENPTAGTGETPIATQGTEFGKTFHRLKLNKNEDL